MAVRLFKKKGIEFMKRNRSMIIAFAGPATSDIFMYIYLSDYSNIFYEFFFYSGNNGFVC